MRVLISPLMVIATVTTVVSAYGYKYSRNPYSGECKLQLNLPGGTDEKDAYRPEIKDAYPGIMNTRYGSNDGKYHAIHHSGGGSFHGAASSQHSALASGSNTYGSGTGSSQSSNRLQGGSSNYGSGSGRYPSPSDSNYGSGSLNSGNNYGSSSSSENFGSSGSNYESSATSQSNNYGNNYGSNTAGSAPYAPGPGNYGGSGGNYNGNDYDSGNYGSSSSGNSGSSNKNYESSSNAASSSFGQDNRGSNYGGSNVRDRDTGSSSYRPRPTEPSFDRDRNTGNYGSNNNDRGTGSYGSSNNRESSFQSSNNHGSSSGHRGSGSSTGNRGHHGTSHQDTLSSSGNRGSSGGSYGGGSSSESFGESDQQSYASSGSSSYAKGDGIRNKGSETNSYATAGVDYNTNEYDSNRKKVASASGSSSSTSAFSASSAERFNSGDIDRELVSLPRPASRPSTSLTSGERYHEEHSRKKVVSSSSSASKVETKKTVVIGNKATVGSHLQTGEIEGQGSHTFASVDHVPSEFEDCGVYEYYSKRYRKCVRIGSPEDEELEREKKEQAVYSNTKSKSHSSAGDGASTLTYAGPNGASSYAAKDGGSTGSVSSYSNSRNGQSSSGAAVLDEYGNNVKSNHVKYNSGSSDSNSSGSSYSSASASSSSASRGSSSGLGFSSTSSSGPTIAGAGGNVNSNNNYDQNNEFVDPRFAREVLLAHNSYRARHDTPPVTLDEKISLKAQEWANELASGRVVYGHSPAAVEGVYGESLQVMNVDRPTGTEVVDHWYKERRNYDYKNPFIVKTPRSRRNSHFTQTIWRSTKKIGVGKATSKDGRSFIVVSYWPPGNIVDFLEDNVLPSRPGLSSREREPFY